MPLIQIFFSSEFTHTACLSDFYVYVNKTNLEFQVMGSSRVHGVGADTVSCFLWEVVKPCCLRGLWGPRRGSRLSTGRSAHQRTKMMVDVHQVFIDKVPRQGGDPYNLSLLLENNSITKSCCIPKYLPYLCDTSLGYLVTKRSWRGGVDPVSCCHWQEEAPCGCGRCCL